jgi:hypothetical protein
MADLIEVLEVNRDRLPSATKRAVDYLQRYWAERGSPSGAEPLEKFLDDAIRFCPTVGFRYPKVFLLRLKQLQRHEWQPEGGRGSL